MVLMFLLILFSFYVFVINIMVAVAIVEKYSILLSLCTVYCNHTELAWWAALINLCCWSCVK